MRKIVRIPSSIRPDVVKNHFYRGFIILPIWKFQLNVGHVRRQHCICFRVLTSSQRDLPKLELQQRHYNGYIHPITNQYCTCQRRKQPPKFACHQVQPAGESISVRKHVDLPEARTNLSGDDAMHTDATTPPTAVRSYTHTRTRDRISAVCQERAAGHRACDELCFFPPITAGLLRRGIFHLRNRASHWLVRSFISIWKMDTLFRERVYRAARGFRSSLPAGG